MFFLRFYVSIEENQQVDGSFKKRATISAGPNGGMNLRTSRVRKTIQLQTTAETTLDSLRSETPRAPGTRFSKVPVTFRARSYILKSKSRE